MKKKKELARLREIIEGLNMIIEIKNLELKEQGFVINSYRDEVAELEREYDETIKVML